MTKASIVIKILPNSDTAHKGILSKNPQSSTASMISLGRTVLVAVSNTDRCHNC